MKVNKRVRLSFPDGGNIKLVQANHRKKSSQVERINTCLMSSKLLSAQRESEGPRAELRCGWRKSRIQSAWYLVDALENKKHTYLVKNLIFRLNVYHSFISAATHHSLFLVCILMLQVTSQTKEGKRL